MRLAHISFQVSTSLIRLPAIEHSKNNTDYATRLNYLRNCNAIELYGRLHADFFNSDKMLINGVDMNIKLTRAPEALYLMAPSDDTKLRIKILDATLSLKSN